MQKNNDQIADAANFLQRTCHTAAVDAGWWTNSGVLLGAILIVAPLITMFKRPYFNSDFSVLLDILLCIVSMVGLFILFHNSATLFFPEGRAINQFIKDVRG